MSQAKDERYIEKITKTIGFMLIAWYSGIFTLSSFFVQPFPFYVTPLFENKTSWYGMIERS